MAVEDIAKKIYDPKRGASLRAQNAQALKKTGKAVADVAKKKGGGLLRGAARFAAPVAVGYGAAERIAANPTDPENVATSGLRSAADLVDKPVSAVSEYFGGPKVRPVGTALDYVSAGSHALGATAADLQAGIPLEESVQNSESIRQAELARRQGLSFAEAPEAAPVTDAEQVDVTGLGAPVPYTAGTTLREGQTDEGYARRVEGPGGAYGEMTTAGRQTTDSPERVGELAEGVAARSGQRVQNILAQQEQAQQARGPSVGDQIAGIEEQLAQPGRGLRQSFGDLLKETQSRKSLRTQLDSLYKARDTATTQAGQTERAALVSQDKARDRGLRYRELVGKQGAAARKERNTLRKEAQATYEEQAKARFADDPKEQAFFVAQNLETHLPGSSFDTPHGRIVRRDAMEDLVKTASDERGLIDWMATKIPGFSTSEKLTYDDLAKIDFSDWNIDKGEIILPEAITSNDAFRTKEGNYAYFDNMSPKTVWFIQQMIKNSKTNKTQTSLREGQ